jgi:Holliday junction DNA helicase RuvA
VIARISGKLVSRRPGEVIVDVGGVGYRLFVSLNSFYALPPKDSEATLHVHTVVRDDAIHLYGFVDHNEKEAFAKLIGVSGVGPKVALSILSGVSPDELWLAVAARDAKSLTKAPGVGKKTANRLVLELEGKLPAPEEAPAAAASPPAAEDAVSALINLGYPEASARKAVDKALADLGPETGVEKLLRESLKRF